DLEQFFNSEFQKLSKLDCVQIVPDYQGRNVEFYDAIQGEYQEDVQFYLNKIGKGPLKILELGSGTGRTAIPLAKAGHTVYALDNSDDMHNILMAKVPTELKNRIIPIKASMTDFNIDVRFDYVILGLNTIFALAEEDDRIRCFKLVRKYLKGEGRFLVDLMLPSPEDLKNTKGKYELSVMETEEGKNCLSVVFNRYDAKRQIMILNYLSIDMEKDDKVKFFITPAVEYYPSPGEIKLLLRNCGFEIELFSCDYEGTPFEDDDTKRDLVICARIA
ncbi:class I SAM-dependent methyltransferase, partial [Dehalococcoidia bacterium]|nr:class I SAM-dependent methyltransferase [Dehalococcoidia bacterium]